MKRPNGEGTIKKRKSGGWEAQYVAGRDQDGRLIRRSIYGRTQAEVSKKLTALTNDLNNGVYIAPDQITVAEAMDVMIKWFCLLFQNQFTPDELLDGYPVDRLMHDISFAMMAVQTQTTQILSSFPTKAAETEKAPMTEHAETPR